MYTAANEKFAGIRYRKVIMRSDSATTFLFTTVCFRHIFYAAPHFKPAYTKASYFCCISTHFCCCPVLPILFSFLLYCTSMLQPFFKSSKNAFKWQTHMSAPSHCHHNSPSCPRVFFVLKICREDNRTKYKGAAYVSQSEA